MKVAAFRDYLDVARVTVRWWPSPTSLLIGFLELRRELPVFAEVTEHVAVVLEPAGNDVNHLAIRIALDDPVHRHQPRTHDDLALLAEHVGPDDEVGDSSLILNGDEHDPLGASRPLAD